MINPFEGLDLMASTVLIFRIMMVPMILYNLSYSCVGFWDLLRGKLNPTSLYRNVVFFACLPLLGFQTVSILSLEHVGSGPWTLAFVLMFTMMNIAAIGGRLLNNSGQFDKFIWLYGEGHLELAARSVLVHALDPEGFEEYLTNKEDNAVKNWTD